MILGHCYPYIYCDLGYQRDMHLVLSSRNGKPVHKSMVENHEEFAQGLVVGTQTLDQPQRCKSYISGLKETHLGKFTPRMVSCKIYLARAN